VTRGNLLAVLLSLVCASPCSWALRPFDTTDADVEKSAEVELELGIARSREDAFDTWILPKAVANFGLGHGRELVVESELIRHEAQAQESSRWTVGESGVFLKQVIRSGSLQEMDGVSVAVECGALIPAPNEDEHVGAECALIASHKWTHIVLHTNAILEWNRQHEAVGAASVIVEGPSVRGVRPVAELLFEKEKGMGTVRSALVGIVYEIGSRCSFDVAIRRSRTAQDEVLELRAGLTLSL